MVKHIHYLDATFEVGSVFILNQLNVTLLPNRLTETSVIELKTSSTSLEHVYSTDVLIVSNSGIVAIDVRDSADCWIRVILEIGDVLSIPPSVFRKVVSLSDDATFEMFSSQHSTAYMGRYLQANDAVEVVTYHSYRELVCELCRQFFNAGWVTGTGGSISIRHGNRIYMTPSGVQKERIQPDELYVLDVYGNVLSVPVRKPGCRQPKLSDCSPLFLHAFQQRNAGAVLHSHSYCTNLVTSMFEGQSEFRISHQEMIKGITGYGYFDELVIPIIENTAWEHELADSLGETIAKNPKACAVLVRRHGMYVWGDSWEQAKRHGECLHYLFDVAIEMHKMGLDYKRAPLTASGKRTVAIEDSPLVQSLNKRAKRADYQHVVFDIEGTTTPITFVKDVLFPFSSSHAKWYFEISWSTSQTQSDVNALLNQAAQDFAEGLPVTDPPSAAAASRNLVIEYLVQYVAYCVEKDRKIAPLKDLQGHIWEVGYSSKEIQSVVFDDVPSCFERLVAGGAKVSIYSSGSRAAQRLLFKHSNYGDLRKLISCYFDTKVGSKRDSASYSEISYYLGVDKPSDILFVTDIIEEAIAADAAGLDVILSDRPGNAALPSDHKFTVVNDFAFI